MDAKLKHLEFIQNIITRMANNSFLLKGWSITVVGALIGLNKEGGIGWQVALLALFLTLMFWILDGFFLSQERHFRGKYDEVRVKEEKDIDFSMQLEGEKTSSMDWFVSMQSKTLLLYYMPILVSIFLFWALM
jgi:hypothetical protein